MAKRRAVSLPVPFFFSIRLTCLDYPSHPPTHFLSPIFPLPLKDSPLPSRRPGAPFYPGAHNIDGNIHIRDGIAENSYGIVRVHYGIVENGYGIEKKRLRSRPYSPFTTRVLLFSSR